MHTCADQMHNTSTTNVITGTFQEGLMHEFENTDANVLGLPGTKVCHWSLPQYCKTHSPPATTSVPIDKVEVLVHNVYKRQPRTSMVSVPQTHASAVDMRPWQVAAYPMEVM